MTRGSTTSTVAICALLRASNIQAEPPENSRLFPQPAFGGKKKSGKGCSTRSRRNIWPRAAVRSTPVYLRDPSKQNVPAGCEFFVPAKVNGHLNEDVISGSRGAFHEYYHFLIDFAPRLLEALETTPDCRRSSTARVWVTRDCSIMERYHLTQGLYCPGGTISVSKDKSKKQPKWPPGKFLVETLADAMKVDLTNSTQRSMQP